jgi:hypothetical protein
MRYRTREETLPLRRSEELSPRRQVRKREHCVHLLFNLSLAIFAPWREILLENVTAGFSEANWPTGQLDCWPETDMTSMESQASGHLDQSRVSSYSGSGQVGQLTS